MDKSSGIDRLRKENCFADDSGLEIEALGGQPGVYSARFAGASINANENMDKVLRVMEGVPNRKAKFRTVIALYWQGQSFFSRVVSKALYR